MRQLKILFFPAHAFRAIGTMPYSTSNVKNFGQIGKKKKTTGYDDPD